MRCLKVLRFEFQSSGIAPEFSEFKLQSRDMVSTTESNFQTPMISFEKTSTELVPSQTEFKTDFKNRVPVGYRKVS